MTSIVGFKADSHSDGADHQTTVADSTFTKVTFTNEVYDVGSYFDLANNKWTPPAGIVAIEARVRVKPTTGTLNSTYICAATIYKNGAIFASSSARQLTSDGNASIVASDSASGTDFYEMYVFSDTTSGVNATVYNGSTGLYTVFSGRSLQTTA